MGVGCSGMVVGPVRRDGFVCFIVHGSVIYEQVYSASGHAEVLSVKGSNTLVRDRCVFSCYSHHCRRTRSVNAFTTHDAEGHIVSCSRSTVGRYCWLSMGVYIGDMHRDIYRVNCACDSDITADGHIAGVGDGGCVAGIVLNELAGHSIKSYDGIICGRARAGDNIGVPG